MLKYSYSRNCIVNWRTKKIKQTHFYRVQYIAWPIPTYQTKSTDKIPKIDSWTFEISSQSRFKAQPLHVQLSMPNKTRLIIHQSLQEERAHVISREARMDYYGISGGYWKHDSRMTDGKVKFALSLSHHWLLRQTRRQSRNFRSFTLKYFVYLVH